MRWLITPILWTLAIVVALGILWRTWRGKPVILRGRWTPRFVRMVALLLVFFGSGDTPSEAAPVPVGDPKKANTDDPFPATITQQILQLQAQRQLWTSDFLAVKRELTLILQSGGKRPEAQMRALETGLQKLPPKMQAMLREDLKAVLEKNESARPTAAELLAVLDEAEQHGYIDFWLVGYLWRKSEHALAGAQRKPAIDLMGRLRRHARLATACTAALAQVKHTIDAPPIAWRSKGGFAKKPRPDELNKQQLIFPPNYMATVQKLYQRAEPGTWEEQGFTMFSLEKGATSVTLIRAGQGQVPRTEGLLPLARLDLLETGAGDKPAVLVHRVYGRIELPAGRLYSVWDIPQHLSVKGKAALSQTIADALAGKEDAARLLEIHLPIVAPILRDELKKNPGMIGAPRLRLILTQFDEVPLTVPVLPESPKGRMRDLEMIERR